MIKGGTWEKIAQGRAIIGASDAYPLNSTGGEATHTLTIEEMPNHYHDTAMDGNEGFKVYLETGSALSQNGVIIDIVQGTRNAYPLKTLGTGGSQPYNNMMPYLALNVWQRIA